MCKRFAKQESSGRSSRNSWMRSPGDDDRTPPELRPGSHSGHPVYSDSSRRNSGRTRHLPGTLPGHNVSRKTHNEKFSLKSYQDILKILYLG